MLGKCVECTFDDDQEVLALAEMFSKMIDKMYIVKNFNIFNF